MTDTTDLAAQMTAWLGAIDSFVWGPAMLVLLLGTGLYLTIGTGLMPMRRIPTAFRLLLRGRTSGAGDKGDITPFQSLMTALSATIGNGNIVGVAAAIALGGPGAVFWMWMTALVGMATKYAEAVLAIRYREVDADGRYVGGPMYYIKNGLGRHWAWLGFLFAFFATIAGFGIGNMFQAKAVVDVVGGNLGIPNWQTGLVMAVLTFLVIIGGVKRIGQVAEFLVPFMAAGLYRRRPASLSPCISAMCRMACSSSFAMPSRRRRRLAASSGPRCGSASSRAWRAASSRTRRVSAARRSHMPQRRPTIPSARA